jgi:hypothetical protein
MIKIVDPRGWDDIESAGPVARTVPVSSRGLRGADRSEFLKTASPEFLNLIDSIKVAKDEVPVHLIALGASEAYGPNRNGDGFKEATCRKYHRTFEKNARWYRNHKNKDKAKSFGYIKKSAYNDAMRRVELLCMLNANKEAADRNGGLVADRELEKLGKGKDLAVSMACRVPYDVCSGCEKKARTREEYCTEDTCKYGGCKDNLTKVAEDGHCLHVDNPDPNWFDISDVYRPADRIAWGSKADWLCKAASADEFLPSHILAQQLGISAPLHVILGQDEPHHWDAALTGQTKLAHGLAELESRARLGSGVDANMLRAFAPGIQDPVADEVFNVLGTPGTEKTAAALGALADKKIIFPLRDFARWLGKSAAADEAQHLLPVIFRHITSSGDLANKLITNQFAVSQKTASAPQRVLAQNMAPTYSFAEDHVRDRVMRSSIRQQSEPALNLDVSGEKRASDNAEAWGLAEAYALYKLAALHRIAGPDKNFDLTGRLALGQNRV